MGFTIRPVTPEDRDWLRQIVTELLGGIPIVTPSGRYAPESLPGFVAVQDGVRVGLLNYHIAGDRCEVVTLASLRPGAGIGTALMEAARRVAVQQGCRRLWLVTTNDNLNALRFYQKRGFLLVALYRNAMDQVRRIKPAVPLVGLDGIPLRDMIELEMPLV